MIIRPRVCKGKFFRELFRLSSQFQLLFAPASSALSLHSSIRTLVQQGSAPTYWQSFASRLCSSVNSREGHRAKAKPAFLCCHVYELRISFSARTRMHKRPVKFSVSTPSAHLCVTGIQQLFMRRVHAEITWISPTSGSRAKQILLGLCAPRVIYPACITNCRIPVTQRKGRTDVKVANLV